MKGLLLEISAKENPSVRLYKKLASNRKSRLISRQFVLEGYRLIYDALSNNANLTHIFFTDEGFERYYEEISKKILSDSIKVMKVTKAVGNYMAETEHTQGIFAICGMPDQLSLNEAIYENGKYLILYQLQDPGNVGMILRTADALGIDGVIFSECCDIYSPKVVRATMGSLFRVKTFILSNIDNVFSICKNYGISLYAAVVNSNAEKIGEVCFLNGCAAVIGNEGNGLPENIVDNCDYRVTIPMNGTIESLNAAMASGIIMWELTKKK